MAMVKSLESHKDLQGFIDRFDNFLFDCDGVIWHGEELIKGVRTVLELLRKSNKKLIFVTNNATKSREAFKAKFDRLGIQADLVCLSHSLAVLNPLFEQSQVLLPLESLEKLTSVFISSSSHPIMYD
jgi:ribonucleotide monophosphatase NagD (HAD superfamily)